MALKEIGCKTLELRNINNVLARIYNAGLNPKEFSQNTRIQDIESISITSVCNEIIRLIADHDNAKKKRRSVAFSELCYIWSGIVFVFKRQITLLYDEALRQAHFTLEYVQRSRTITSMWEKQPAPSALSKTGRARKNSDPTERFPKRRVKFSAQVEYDWQSLDDNEVDADATIKILQTSKVMNRDQISIHEVNAQPLPTGLSQCDEFEAVECYSTENFLEIRELVAHGRSIVDVIRSERVSTMNTGDCEPFDEDGYYAPMTPPQSNPPMTPPQSSPRPQTPLPDIERCYEELDRDVPNQDKTIERVGSSLSRFILLPPPPSRDELLPKRTGKGGRRRIVFDHQTQIPLKFNEESDKKLMRCADASSDHVKKEHIMRELKLINFHKPAHAFRSLRPRESVKEIAPLMAGMKRVQKAKRNEPNDLNMVQDFFNTSDNNRQENAQLVDIQIENPQHVDEPRENRGNQSLKRKRSSSTHDEGAQPCNKRFSERNEVCALDLGLQDDNESMDIPDETEPNFEPEPVCSPGPSPEPIVAPEQNRFNQSLKRKRSSSTHDEDAQPCNKRFSEANGVCALDLGFRDDDESMDIPDEAEPTFEQEPVCSPEPIVEPEQSYEYEPNLPSVNRSPLGSPIRSPLASPLRSKTNGQMESAPALNMSRTSNFRLQSDTIPRSVLRLLNQFVTVNAEDGLASTSSQRLLLLSNQKNRESWGLKGVLQNLFRLWHQNVYPLGMMELMYPEKKKLAAALAFYSIMELNSPRIGLIVIQKVENSNAVRNIAMSEKLIELLRKSNRN